MVRNVFVVGLDDHNRRVLRAMPDAEHYRFHSLLSIEELQHRDKIALEGLLAKARARLESFDGSVDAIVGFWDFPVSSMVPLLCRRFGLPQCLSLEAVVKCEHKYWCRLEQRKVIDEYPRFGLVDLDHDEGPPAGITYPLWLKPVKSFSSTLAYCARNPQEFRTARQAIRAGIARIGQPFDRVLTQLDLPAEIAGIGGQACLAEEAMRGRQVTLEGYRYHGEVHVYGVVDSVPCEGSPSFSRFQYPSNLPATVTQRLTDITERVTGQLGLDDATFNIEFIWDPDTDTTGLLEVNPRHSQSHAQLFSYVDGLANHHCMLQLAFGRPPRLPHRQGKYAIAAKWFLRRFADGIVVRHPTEEEIAAVEYEIPGTHVDLIVHTGDRLSELYDQDSYSYKLANIYIGAANETELVEKFQRCEQKLPFEFSG
jgi:hypothetical protein